jgi:mRNA deadenylase 3'-5' endonuclease subunit Ccr4
MQMNVLAASMCTDTPPFGFTFAKKEALDLSNRRELYRQEISLTAQFPEIICMEEVDCYDEWWKDNLLKLGYESMWIKKMGDGLDGILIAYLPKRFQPVPFSHTSQPSLDILKPHGTDSCLKSAQDACRFWKIGNSQVSVTVLLQCQQSNEIISVTTTHLKAKQGKANVASRVAQAKQLVSNLTECIQTECAHRKLCAIPTFMCMDMNDERPDGNSLSDEQLKRLEYLETFVADNEGKESQESLDKLKLEMDTLEKAKEVTEGACFQVFQSAGFYSSYDAVFSQKDTCFSSDDPSADKPYVSTFKKRSTGVMKRVIDYIWMNDKPRLFPSSSSSTSSSSSDPSLYVKAVLASPSMSDLQDHLPCVHYPSDHLAICTHFVKV